MSPLPALLEDDGLAETPHPGVNVVIVYNPLDLSNRETHRLDYEADRSLEAYLEGLPEDVEWHVTVNGEPCERGTWLLRIPAPGDWISLIPVPEGGEGGGKGVLRIVAMLAIAVVAAYTGGAAAAALMGKETIGAALATTSGMLISATVTTGVTMVGGNLINAELPA